MAGFFSQRSQSATPDNQAAFIKDTNTENFMLDVIEESQKQPVLVDVWAPWCGPCKTLGPIIEKTVTQAQGRVKLAKLNMDTDPSIPSQLGIKSIPAVIAFKEGRPVDGFMGALPESQIKAFVDKIAGVPEPSAAEVSLEQANQALAQDAFSDAAQGFTAVLSQEPENVEALCGLVRCYVGINDAVRARQVFDSLCDEGRKTPAAQLALKALELAEQAESLGDLAELQALVAAEPDNLQACFDLALGLNSKGQKKRAVDRLLEIIRKDREWQDDGARKRLLELFETWGDKDAATLYGRQKLSLVLFS